MHPQLLALQHSAAGWLLWTAELDLAALLCVVAVTVLLMACLDLAEIAEVVATVAVVVVADFAAVV